MRTLAEATVGWGFDAYDMGWRRAARAGWASLALDTRLHGRRYLSLNPVVLTRAEAEQLAALTVAFSALLDRAVSGLLDDPDWWPWLAWPRPAIELARHEPCHPHGRSTLYGRFDWLLEPATARWQLVEYNADTPSGGREASGLEPAVFRLHGGHAAGLRRLSGGLAERLARTLVERLAAAGAGPAGARAGRPGVVGVVASHGWVEDTAQAWWLAQLLRARGVEALVGDVRDLALRSGRVTLRGRRIDALYRFYPVEALYRHGVFAPLMDAAAEGRVLLLNGLRGFLAQSKTTLAWLWAHRSDRGFEPWERALIEAHLPPIAPASRWPPAEARSCHRPASEAEAQRADGGPEAAATRDTVVKHVNGREGDSVVFGDSLDEEGWERRLLEGGYVVQRRVVPQALEDVEVDESGCRLAVARPRYACVGSFAIGGRFGGCYTRLGGLITTARSTFVATLAADARSASA
jgi:glutathionylspermidine synthase